MPGVTQFHPSHPHNTGKPPLGKPLNFTRLVKASATFEGAARYAAWKIERHTGMPVEVTPFRERHPVLSAPSVLWALRKHRKRK